MKRPMLSEHFSFDELTVCRRHPELADKNRLEASAFCDKLTDLCQAVLEPVRSAFGPVVITSGYRCPALNAAVGGAATSQHAKAEAADFIVPGRDLDDVFEWIQKAIIPFDQVILEPGWIHVSYCGQPGNRREALIFDGKTYRKA